MNIVRHADIVIAGNKILAEHAREFNPNVFVIPSAVETRNVPVKSFMGEDNITVIGWVGGSVNLHHLEMLSPVLKRLSEEFKIEVRIICDRGIDLPGVDVKFIPWSLDNQEEEIAKFDIGVMPLPDNKHSEGKCGYKALQYMAASVPPVVSDVGTNADIVGDGEEGIVVSDIEEFYDAIKVLINDLQKRKQMGIAARKRVESEYSVQKVGSKLAGIITGAFGPGMERVSCDLCGSRENIRYLTSKDYINKIEGLFNVVRCRMCDLVFTNPRPDRDEMQRFYPSTTPYYKYDEKSVKPMKVTKGIYKRFLDVYRGYAGDGKGNNLLKAYLLPIYMIKGHKLYARAIPDFVEGGRLLEVGCSYGRYLHSMEVLGWNVTGVEMSKKAVDAADELYGLKIINSNIDQVEFGEYEFDVIVLRMVLEHVFSPSLLLKKSLKWLKPGGRIIITVPDISSVEAFVFRKYFYGLQVPTHLYHFSPGTVRHYLRNFDFKEIKIYHDRTDSDFFGSLDNFIEDNPRWRFIRILRKGLFKIFVRLAITAISMICRSGRMTVYAVKSSQ
ncbi:MAG: methyltransferase domain-containing protein [Nitrospirota bacterium]|nr:MAG: methyltransferase domain-containing protein [Nitrospirota bacterium]